MARIRSQNELILSLLDFFRTAQPNLDTKPGTVSRDLLVDGPCAQVSRLYQELERISTLQSLRLAIGADLDKLAANFGETRKRGTKSSGPSLLTFNSIDSDIPINRGDLVNSRNGATFIVQTGLVVSPVFSNTYRATASQYRAELDLAGITDELAIEVLVESAAPGVQGNISKYNLTNCNIAGVSNVTNVFPFGGGSHAEDDAAFRSRLLAVFSGANTGTSLGYKNAVLEDPAAMDAFVVEPGNSLLVRDGTQVYVNPETGERTIISEGTGGKVDIYVFGTRLQEIIESYVYTDRSNTGNPTNLVNDHVLGQIVADAGKTVTKKRLDNLASGILPNQPVNDIVSVSGSVSGNNFIEKSVDEYGRISGNYELIKDTGAYGGSVWGFDRLHWINNKIEGLPEDKTKGAFNGQDTLTFSDVSVITNSVQRINVVNENSRVSNNNRASIQLFHSPIINVTRVFNATTGERYVITNQNPDGSGNINETGRIIVRGSSLPSSSDTLQVDYTWIHDFDPYIDFDGKISNINPNPREVQDSIDWGYSNAVRREEVTLVAAGPVLTATVTHPVTTVLSVNVVNQEAGTVTLVNGREAVVVGAAIENVVSVVRVTDGTDLWNTSKEDGSFSGFTVFLPTDGLASFGDDVYVVYNTVDVFNADGYEGSFDNKIITIVPSVTAVAGTVVEVDYIANVNVVLPATVLSQLPAIRNLNGLDTVSSVGVGTQPTTHIFSSGITIEKNLRQAPANLAFVISGSISAGIFTVAGTTMHKVSEAVFTVGTDGRTIQLSQPIKEDLGLASNASIPSNLQLARVVSVEKVQAASNLEVLSVDHTYDIKGYQLRDNSFFKSESVLNSSLTVTQFILPDTLDNQAYAPRVGDRLRVTFYYILTGNTENISFSKSGTLWSDKKFALIDSIAVSSGFTSGSSQSASLTVYNLNQPSTGARYQSNYDYIAPKANERITVRFNLNKLIGDSTVAIEDTRPITADVLSKEATAIRIDITMNIVLFPEYVNNVTTVRQNVQDAIATALNATTLGTIVDSSDLVVAAQGIAGVDRVRVLFFNTADTPGTVLSIEADDNEYLQANNVTINIESR